VDAVEIESLLEEQGSITMDCEFCNQQYAFYREDLVALLPPPNPTLLH
jgi:molecular chaperone Hsp33